MNTASNMQKMVSSRIPFQSPHQTTIVKLQILMMYVFYSEIK